MHPGDRYGAWRASANVLESSLLPNQRDLSEHEVQALWFAGEFGCEFTSTAGAKIRIVQFGEWNHEAGPDFAEAAISIDDAAPIRGAIELDLDARDWERHGHGTNRDYERVILHLFTQSGGGDFFTRTAAHRNVPQVQLDLASIERVRANAQPDAKLGRCAAPLRALPEERVREILLAAAQFRLRRKATALATTTELHGADEALFQALAAALGYKSNKLPFTLLAQRLSLRTLLRAKADADALLFGVAGFLNATDLAGFEQSTRAYLRSIWEKWWPRRAEFERLTIPRELWKMSGQRPANHPQRRLAALAALVRQWPKLRALRDRCEPAEIEEFFANLHDDYWAHHFTVTSKTAAKPMALIGSSRATEMLVNVFFPIAIAADPQRWIGFKNLPAASDNKRVETAAARLFGSEPLARELMKSAAMQQGLLQIYEDFCMHDASDCERCRFPTQLAQW